jgi:hypothetical protein
VGSTFMLNVPIESGRGARREKEFEHLYFTACCCLRVALRAVQDARMIRGAINYGHPAQGCSFQITTKGSQNDFDGKLLNHFVYLRLCRFALLVQFIFLGLEFFKTCFLIGELLRVALCQRLFFRAAL